MSAPPAAVPLRRFSIEALSREAWKNGGGWTRTVASHHVQGQIYWRVSVADIDASGPFSRFEGMDRIAVVVRGTGLRLSSESRVWNLDSLGSIAQFPGELAFRGDALEVPVQLWNVMVRRGQAQADLLLVEDETVQIPSAPHVLILVLRGRFELSLSEAGPIILADGEGLHLQGRAATGYLAPREANSLLLITVLR